MLVCVWHMKCQQLFEFLLHTRYFNGIPIIISIKQKYVITCIILYGYIYNNFTVLCTRKLDDDSKK